jgi:hypothetical protein
MKQLKVWLSIISTFALFGCSAIMAASGSKSPDLSVLEPGTSRSKIEEVLGKPIRQRRLRWLDEATYQFFTNDEANYGRATSLAVISAFSLGLTEIITAPIEAVQGDRHEIIVTYSRSGRLRKFKHITHKAPIKPLGHVAEKEPGTF